MLAVPTMAPATPADPAVLKKYKIGETLGRGAFSEVVRAANQETGDVVALKIISNPRSDPQYEAELAAVENEIHILQKLDHPRIVKMYECFHTGDFVYVAMELLTGGELFDRVSEEGFFSEDKARRVVRQMLEGIAYLHDLGVAHRDLKPENILFTKPDENNIKITDFGLSRIREDPAAAMKTQCGSPLYIAPEIIMGDSYGVAVDMWAVGVITYILLCGYPPFEGATVMRMYRSIRTAQYDFNEDHWSDISPSAKDFIRKLLVVDPEKRMTAEDALQHDWIRQAQSTADISSIIRRNLRATFRKRWQDAIKTTIMVNRLGHLLDKVRMTPNASLGSPFIPHAVTNGDKPSGMAPLKVNVCECDSSAPVEKKICIHFAVKPQALFDIVRNWSPDVADVSTIETVAEISLVGNCEALAHWDAMNGVHMQLDPDAGEFVGCAMVPQAYNLQYKYTVRNKKTGEVVWLPGANLNLFTIQNSGGHIHKHVW